MTRTPIKAIVKGKPIPPRAIVRAVMALRYGLLRAADALAPSDVRVMERMSVRGMPVAVAIATRMRIPDVLADRGPMTAAQLGPMVGADPGVLHRMLRFLCCWDVFRVDREGRFSNTRVSSQLMESKVMHNAALLLGSRLNYALWGDLERTLQTGQNAFERLYGPVWQWFAAHPEDGILFVNGMASMTAMEAPALSAAYPYGRFGVLCDIGGGSGLLVACILARFPELRAVLFDHESMLEHAHEYLSDANVLDRVELVSGDFFEVVPREADAYLLKDILHDWTDEQCCKILRNIRSAAKPGTTLLIHETLAEIDSLGPAAVMDLQMAISTEQGRNRSRAEFKELLDRCGFTLTRVIALAVPTSILEAVAV